MSHFSRFARSLVLIVGASVAGGSAAAGDIQVTDAWSRPTPPGAEVGVAYLVIRNSGKNDRLVRASSPAAGRAELHISSMKNGVMKMERTSTVEIGSGASTSFEPNGRHVMLIGLKRPLKEGDMFPLVLNFANAGPVKVQVHVRSTDGMGDGGHAMDHSKMQGMHTH